MCIYVIIVQSSGHVNVAFDQGKIKRGSSHEACLLKNPGGFYAYFHVHLHGSRSINDSYRFMCECE